MRYTGRCHCGNLEVAFEPTWPASELQLRECACSFCRRHGATSVTDPSGKVEIVLRAPAGVSRYRFGLLTADFFVCRTCGVYVGAACTIDGAAYATLNVSVLDDRGAFTGTPTSVSFEGETVAERLARRRRAWTPAVVRELSGAGAPDGLEAAPETHKLTKVISGGQTGVDQAALRAALACGIARGGWCPPGRESEAGPIPEDLPLVETPSDRSPDAPDTPRSLRTEWNVRDSDATLILRPASCARVDPGTEWTLRCSYRLGRAVLVCDPEDPDAAPRIVRWIRALPVRTLHVAGPAESVCPGIGALAQPVLMRAFTGLVAPATWREAAGDGSGGGRRE